MKTVMNKCDDCIWNVSLTSEYKICGYAKKPFITNLTYIPPCEHYLIHVKGVKVDENIQVKTTDKDKIIKELKKENNDLLNTVDRQQKLNNQLTKKKRELEEENKRLQAQLKERRYKITNAPLMVVDSVNSAQSKIKRKVRYLRNTTISPFELLALQTMEECGELIQALSKYVRDDIPAELIRISKKENVIEEIADVLVCIERLKDWLNISDEEIENMMLFKLDRTIERGKSK